MPQPIIRLYESRDPAMGAAKALKEQGFPGDKIGILSRHAEADEPEPTRSDRMAAIGSVGVSGRDAEHYAQAVERGGALPCVWPPYGRDRRYGSWTGSSR